MTKVTITLQDTPEGLVDVEVEITGFNEESNAQALAKRAMDYIHEVAFQMPETSLPGHPAAGGEPAAPEEPVQPEATKSLIIVPGDKPLRLHSA